MANQEHVAALEGVKTFFDRTLACFQAEDGDFSPQEGMFTTAEHVAHTAQVVEWFLEGAFRPQGMGTEFETMEAEVRKVDSLNDAITWWNDAMQEAIEAVGNAAPESWGEAIRGPIMSGEPRHAIIPAIGDHTAHHRGALAVYARLQGRTPAMPYA